MSELQKRIDETTEFINDAQAVIERLNDTLFALNQLIQNQDGGNQNERLSPLEKESFERDFRELVARHLGLDPSSEKLVVNAQALSVDKKKTISARPGKYRSLV